MRSLSERFWERVDRSALSPGGCWTWLGASDRNGYGMVSWEKKRRLAHRVAWELERGSLDGQCCLHKCDTPSCVNPDHLFLGSQLENIADMDAKGRRWRPALDRHPRRKLSSHDVVDVVSLRAFGARVCDLAAAFGVAGSTISMIVTGRNWVAR